KIIGHHREWPDNGSGYGEYAYVLPAASAKDLAASYNHAEQACQKYTVNGTTNTKATAETIFGVSEAVPFCEKHDNPSHPPVSYGCYAVLGRGRLFVIVYGYADTLTNANEQLGWPCGEVYRRIHSVPEA